MLYLRCVSLFDHCTDEQAGKLIKACFHYMMDGQYPYSQLYGDGGPDDDPLIGGYFSAVLQPDLDADIERYNRVSEERAKAGSRGGQAKASNAKRRNSFLPD